MKSLFSIGKKREVSSHKINQQISVMLSNGRLSPVVDHIYALLACNATVPYLDDIINHLFKYHLSQTTLHYHIMSQLRQLLQFIDELNDSYNYMYNSTSVSSIKKTNSKARRISKIAESPFEIQSSKHSCQLIMTQLTEDSQITHDVARAIRVISKDPVIQHTLTTIQDAQNMDNNNTGIINSTRAPKTNVNPKSNTDDYNYNQDIVNRVASKLKESEYWFDVPFCQYFFENITDYASIKYYYENQRNDKALIFDEKTFEDCKLLKNHITMKHGRKIELCHCEYTTDNVKARQQAEQQNVRFILGRECQIVIFNVEKDGINLSLGWYKNVLASFASMIFCLPLSWFDEMRPKPIATIISKSNNCKQESVNGKQQNKACLEHLQLYYDLIHFYEEIIKYDDHRWQSHEKNYDRKLVLRRQHANEHGWRRLPIHLSVWSFPKNPVKSFWIIPDLKNMNMNNNNNNAFNAYSAMEQKFIENLLRWKTVFSKHTDNTNNMHTTNENIENIDSAGDGRSDDYENTNVYFKDLINYENIQYPDQWAQFRSRTFMEGYRRMGIYYTPLAKDKEYLHDSDVKQDLNSEYREINRIFFHWCYNYGHYIRYDPRLEYFRIFLNYPTLYKPSIHVKQFFQHRRAMQNTGLFRILGVNPNNIDNVNFQSHIRTMESLCTLTHHQFASVVIDEQLPGNNHNHGTLVGLPIDEIPANRLLKNMLNFEYCDEIERLFEYAENKIDREFNLIDKSNGDIGLSIERVLCFGFKDRLNKIIKNISLFVDNGINSNSVNNNSNNNGNNVNKNKKRQFESMVRIVDQGDEFEYENYVRLALNDWNFSILALFNKSLRGSRAPFKTQGERTFSN